MICRWVKAFGRLNNCIWWFAGGGWEEGVVEVEVVAVTGDTDLPPATGTTLTEDRLHMMTTTDTLQGMTAEDLPQRGDYDTQFWKSFHLVS